MSGHSKWHNIQAKKGKVDARRGKIFTKIGKELAVSAKNGGSNPDMNGRLNDLVAKAKAANMPQDTIYKAIKKGAGEMEGVNYEEIVYEGYAPAGVAIVVSTLTDNKNRSAANVRHAFTKTGGNLGSSGCVSYMFLTKGQIIIEKTEKIDEDDLMMAALDAGAEDVNTEEEVFEILTTQADFTKVRLALESLGYNFISAEVTMIPDLFVSVGVEDAVKVQRLIDALEDDDDVQDVYHNCEFPEEWEG
ncbi:MAG TPA: YebC/PmpR family DNA-binding transcriptional regulator [Clostridiaceae bacterium]